MKLPKRGIMVNFEGIIFPLKLSENNPILPYKQLPKKAFL